MRETGTAKAAKGGARRRAVAIAMASEAEATSLETIIAGLKLDVRRFSTAGDFRKAIPGSVPDLAILDSSLPDEPGFILCKELRENPETKHMSVLVLLPPKGATIEECFISGINDFLARPIDDAEVLRKVGRLTNVPGRRRLNTLALVKPDGSDAALLGRAVNLSPTGILLELDAVLPVGTVCEVRFNLPGQSDPVRARGVVRRRAREGGLDPGGFGIEFATLAAEDRGRLLRFFGENAPPGGQW